MAIRDRVEAKRAELNAKMAFEVEIENPLAETRQSDNGSSDAKQKDADFDETE